MKHAIIVAHPNRDSLTCAVARTYSDAVAGLGHEPITRDLYRLGFDPRLKASEIPGLRTPDFGADVLTERAVLADADVFAFVYPLWFNAPPAILKGYVDRVFGMGFGYEPASGGTASMLDGRKLISFSSSGAPEAWVRDTGALTALMTLFDAHLAGVCGLTVVDHHHTGGVTPGITAEAVDDILASVRAATLAAWTSSDLQRAV